MSEKWLEAAYSQTREKMSTIRKVILDSIKKEAKERDMAKNDEDFKETIHMTEDEKWRNVCKPIAVEIEELLEININAIRESYKTGAPSPSITLQMKEPDAGDMPKMKIKINLPKAKGMDERDLDLNQPRWWRQE